MNSSIDAHKRPTTVRSRLLTRIAAGKAGVFLRSDFQDLGSDSQVGRQLGQLIREGTLVRLSLGVYVRGRRSSIDQTPMPDGNWSEMVAEALVRLGIAKTPTWLEKAYAAGEISQVPTGRVVGVRGRVSRKMSINGVPIILKTVPVRDDVNQHDRRKKTLDRLSALDQDLGLMTSGGRPGADRPLSVRDVLLEILEADKYPCLGNEDWKVAERMEAEALAKAGDASPSPDDPPEFKGWLAALQAAGQRGHVRTAVFEAMYDYFEPDDGPDHAS